MITNSMANMDFPICGKSFNQKLIWIESEISMCVKLNDSYGYNFDRCPDSQ